ncbi:MAG: metallophosphoesterase family protein [Bradymonadaceae bacterium]
MTMTRVAIIADIHANLPALEAVETDLGMQNIDEVLVAGDLVGRGPQGRAVVSRVAERDWRTIRGNHEDYVLSFRRHDVPSNWLEAREWAASRWMAAELDEDSVAFLDALPFSCTSALAPQIRIFHGSPRSYCEGLGKWTKDDILRGHLDSIDEPVLVCAHTHRPLLKRLDEGLVVNVGSVGLPFNADWRAQYAILTVDESSGHIDVEFRQVPYDREAFLETYQTSGFLEEGGVTARLLFMEVEQARPFLVPFLKWIEALEVEAVQEYLPEFLDAYDCTRPLSEFFGALRNAQP